MNVHEIMGGGREWLFRLVADRLGPVTSLLDVGAGDGGFLETARAAEKMGVDPDPASARAARDKGLAVEEGEGREFLRRADRSWDAITLLDVIEHMDYPEADELLSLCDPRCRVLVLNVPNPWWMFWVHPDHVRPYHPDFLRRYLETKGRSVRVYENVPAIEGRPLRRLKHGFRRLLLKAVGLDEVYHLTKVSSYTVVAERGSDSRER